MRDKRETSRRCPVHPELQHSALDAFLPATEEEQRLVQSITDSYWRFNRLQRMETGILIKGHIESANKYEDQPEYRRRQLIETNTYLKYEESNPQPAHPGSASASPHRKGSG